MSDHCPSPPPTPLRAAVSFRRRMAALVYDAIAVSAVVYFAAFVPVIAAGSGAHAARSPLFPLYLVTVMFLYFGLSWRRGRTLGMQAWKLEIVTATGAYPSWRSAALRFAVAVPSLLLGGAGYLCALLDRERRTWPDRCSGTRLVRRDVTAGDGS